MTAPPDAFEAFVVARRDQLYRSAYLLTGSTQRAEDLVQDALARTFVHWRRVSRSDDPAAYVHRIVMNAFLSDRGRRRSTEVPFDHTADHSWDRTTGPTPAADAASLDRLALLEALAGLAPLDRAVVVVRYFEVPSVSDVAEELDLSAAAVKNRSLRALRALRTQLTDQTQDSCHD